MSDIKASDIEIAIARYFNPRQNLIVPNISWGMGLHECDILIASAKGYLTEIEIKISAADLKKDAMKRHGHYDRMGRIKKLYFTMPKKMTHLCEYVPERAGILSYYVDDTGNSHIREIRPARANAKARPLNDKEMYEMARLGSMRIWGLKRKIKYLQERKNVRP
jgi:hypothetical protein